MSSYCYEVYIEDTHVRVSPSVQARAEEGDELMAPLVHHEPAHLALVALLPKAPTIFLLEFTFSEGERIRGDAQTDIFPDRKGFDSTAQI